MTVGRCLLAVVRCGLVVVAFSSLLFRGCVLLFVVRCAVCVDV